LYKLSAIKGALKIIKQADAFTAVGNPLVSKLKRLGINAELVPNFLDLKAFEKAKPNAELKKVKMKKLLFSGRLSQERGIGLLAGVMNELLSERNDFCFVIAGEGELKNLLEEVKEKFPNNVLLLGRKPYGELLGIYKSIDAVLIPAILDEPFGRVMIEGMAAKKPVFASKIGNYKDVIIDGKNGFLIDGRNPEEWSEKITRAFASEKGLEKIAKAGFETAKKQFSEKKVSEKLVKIYENSRLNFA
jgi:glycosyltransferase involved in cell wall biosynthesis